MKQNVIGVVVLALALVGCGRHPEAGSEDRGSGTPGASTTVQASGPWLVPITPAVDAGDEGPIDAAPREPSAATREWAAAVAGLFGGGFELGTVSELEEPAGTTIITVQLRTTGGVLRVSSQRLHEPLQILPEGVENGGPLGSYSRRAGAGETLIARLDAAFGTDSEDVRVFRVDESGHLVVVSSTLLEPADDRKPAPELTPEDLVRKADQIIELKETPR